MNNFQSNIAITGADIEKLMQLIVPYLSDKRYEHSLYVMKEAENLGKIFLPDKVSKLKVAALLHDITKMADFKKQLQYCKEFDIIIGSDFCDSPEVLHALTAKEVAKRDFYSFVDDEILSAIKNHTTGSEDMTLFDTIINLADYIEESRTHDSCQSLRKYFYDRINAGDDKFVVLYDTMVFMFDTTISYLIKKGAVINKDTVAARNYFIKLCKNRIET